MSRGGMPVLLGRRGCMINLFQEPVVGITMLLGRMVGTLLRWSRRSRGYRMRVRSGRRFTHMGRGGRDSLWLHQHWGRRLFDLLALGMLLLDNRLPGW